MRGEEAASPLAVIGTVVAVAVVVTAGVFLLFFNDPEPALTLQRVEEGPHLEVMETRGGLQWATLDVRFVDRGGADRSDLLVLPEGPVEPGQAITFTAVPPAGRYLLSIWEDDRELERLVLSF